MVFGNCTRVSCLTIYVCRQFLVLRWSCSIFWVKFCASCDVQFSKLSVVRFARRAVLWALELRVGNVWHTYVDRSVFLVFLCISWPMRCTFSCVISFVHYPLWAFSLVSCAFFCEWCFYVFYVMSCVLLVAHFVRCMRAFWDIYGALCFSHGSHVDCGFETLFWMEPLCLQMARFTYQLSNVFCSKSTENGIRVEPSHVQNA